MNTVHDVIKAECNLEPVTCIHCGSEEVTFHQYIGDGYCNTCGKWQLAELQESTNEFYEWFEEKYLGEDNE